MDTATQTDDGTYRVRAPASQKTLGLAIVFSLDEPNRVGEVVLVPSGHARVLGRGSERDDDPRPRAVFVRQRPQATVPTGPLQSLKVSRDQLVIQPLDETRLFLQNVGRSKLLHNGEIADELEVSPGDLIQLGSQLLLLCIERPLQLPATPDAASDFPFGTADQHGVVGESPAIWLLRQALGFVGRLSGHLLIRGETGSGKELAARAVHRLSNRVEQELVARNAATFPDALIDAELFGNARDYPNRGMPERPGLIGQADGSCLFLDEIGELPHALQAHLLRVLDAGEYQRLGEARLRKSDFRLIAATNRPESSLKPDLCARFEFRIQLPGLNACREDIPLLTRHLLRRMSTQDPQVSQRFFDENDVARISIELCHQLVAHDYSANVRELRNLVWQAVMESTGTWLEPLQSVPVAATTPDAVEARRPVDAEQLQSIDVQAALDEHNGVLERTWRALGLKNRFVLMRLIAKHGLEVRRRSIGSRSRS